ncbi:hypothetical protein Ancab_002818 [Ancistrocladus abbreviatus]
MVAILIGACYRDVAVSTSRTARRAGRIMCKSPEIVVELYSVTELTWQFDIGKMKSVKLTHLDFIFLSQSLVLESDNPVLVELWAPWCGPYRRIFSILMRGESPSSATQYGIRSISTIMIINNVDADFTAKLDDSGLRTGL